MQLTIRFSWVAALLTAGMCSSGLPCLAQKQPVSVKKEQLTVDGLKAAQVDDDHTYYAFNHRYQGVKGSPYLLRTWQKADLSLQNGQVIKDVLIKYDLIENNLMAIRQPSDSIILASGWVKEFVLHEFVLQPVPQTVDRLYRRYAFQQDGKVVDNYFEVLAEGKDLVLLKRTRKQMQRFNAAVSSYSAQSGFDEIEDKTEYYLFTATGQAQPVKLSRKGLDKAFEALGGANQPASAASSAAIRSEHELVVAFQQAAALR